jgi:hypothetical protein
VAVRENESALPGGAREVGVTYRLCHGELNQGDGRIAYQARGITISRPARDE